ncbi:hypothetical protein JCM15519_20500 [Fundidesulfovibrio butyratiphilus]
MSASAFPSPSPFRRARRAPRAHARPRGGVSRRRSASRGPHGLLAAHSQVLHALRERVKELNCLYRITRLSQNEDLSTADLAKGIAEVVRESWQHPKAACARVAVEGEDYRTEGYAATPWVQASPVRLRGEQAGLVEVRYLRKFPDCGEGPFLREERHLLDAVADLLGRIVESRRIKARLGRLSCELIRAQESERQRIARDLHDKAAQDLSLIKMELEALPTRHGPLAPETAAHVGRLLSQTGAVIGEIRTIAYDLLPPELEQLGLPSAAYRLCKEFAARHEIRVDFSSDGMSQLKLGFETQINLYRILQEALANIRKHSGAERVRVALVASHPNVILRVEDDGAGFAPDVPAVPTSSERGMGLAGMRERARLIGARLAIRSAPGGGTRILVEAPARMETRP